MEVQPVRLPLVHMGDNALRLLLSALARLRSGPKDGDVIVIASKILATAEGRVVDLNWTRPKNRALNLARKYQMDPAHVQVIIDESDQVLGGIHKTLITIKDDILIANGGVDKSNAPPGHVILWPSSPDKWASRIRRAVKKRFHAKVAAIIADSRVHPMRIGTIGCAIGISGIDPIREYRGILDLYGKPLLISRLAVADDLASTAHVMMGEAAEKIGVVIIRGAPFLPSEDKGSRDMVIDPEDCLFMGSIFRYRKKLRLSARRKGKEGLIC